MLMMRSRQTPEQIAERDARHEKIAKCFDAGTCYICDQPVSDDEPRHGPTGAHWACHQPSDQQSPFEVIREVTKALGPPPSTDRHPRMARANGGQLVHFVIPATGTSLCGHKPKDTAHHMKQRGRWLFFKEDAVIPSHLRQCEKCLAQAKVQYPTVEDEPS